MSRKMMALFLCLVTVLSISAPAASALEENKKTEKKFTIDNPYTFNSLLDAEGIRPQAPSSPVYTASALPAATPVNCSKTLPHDEYSSKTGKFVCAFETYTYKPAATGYYGFTCYSPTGEDTDIAVTLGTEYLGGDFSYEPFNCYVYLEKGKTYTIEIDNYGVENSDTLTRTVNYILTVPKTIASTACSVNSGGKVKEWLQYFEYSNPSDGSRSVSIDAPAGGKYSLLVMDSEQYYIYSNLTAGRCFTFTLKKGVCDILLVMSAANKTDSFTFSLDTDAAMADNTAYTDTLAANDILTGGTYTPANTGLHRITANRADAQLSVYKASTGEAPGNAVVENAPANTTLPLYQGIAYNLCFKTNGTSGSITYKAKYLSSDGSLASLGNSSGRLSPAFHKDTLNYTLLADSTEDASIEFTPVRGNANAALTIDGVSRSSLTVPTPYGTEKTVRLGVKSEDGTDQRTYAVAIRTLSQACDLLSAANPAGSFDGQAVKATVNDGTVSQAINVDVSALASWSLVPNADGTGTPLANSTMALHEGLNKAYIKVVSEDGRKKKIYPVLVYRLSSTARPAVLGIGANYREVADNGFSPGDVAVKLFGTPSLVYSAAGYTWPSDNKFSQERSYIITCTDGNGNSAEPYHFTVDKTAPAISLKDAANTPVAKGAFSAKDVTASVADANPGINAVRKDNAGLPWPSDNSFKADGAYALSSIDKAGNASAISFTIDKTAPAIIAATTAGALNDGGYSKLDATVHVTDTNLKSKTAVKNGAPFGWPANNKFTANGVYAVTAQDKAGNTGTFSFTIDKAQPVITAKTTSGKKLKNNEVTNKSVVVALNKTAIKGRTVKLDNVLLTWPANNTFSGEGKYAIAVTDMAGNTVTFAFKIDKKPVISVKTAGKGEKIRSNGFTRSEAVITIKDKYRTSRTLKKNGRKISWPSGGKVKSDGVYTIKAKDKYGNTSEFRFTFDKTNPKVTAKTSKGRKLSCNGYTRDNVFIAVSDKNLLSKAAYKNGAAIKYPSKGKFTAEGVYLVEAVDKANNKTSFSFTIDRS